mmetsp:Transcript_32716/g.37372  ORF Transcript_32716/g.37372 Transcript_32716/m.37372 type:complete len:127 (-) Transcript_32716:251-631(-)|eukprot:CAMPEP_0168331032 /NCGR_PEP_ID=MMETSP0213-20121227/8091_1 /TAXON_ID=151035 /ORGANISM="Euplotes harpa, Strain FSP1.4" /LENGTH=126 /DNA_ID=CAMNT_0008334729 /DNA_START=571 /DNA_END=951 /DNA_ORIENTATION=+
MNKDDQKLDLKTSSVQVQIQAQDDENYESDIDSYDNNISEKNVKSKALKARLQKPKKMFSEEVSDLLMDWLKTHAEYPYPTESERIELCEATRLSRKQLRIWFINTRKRKLEKVKYQVNELKRRDK